MLAMIKVIEKGEEDLVLVNTDQILDVRKVEKGMYMVILNAWDYQTNWFRFHITDKESLISLLNFVNGNSTIIGDEIPEN